MLVVSKCRTHLQITHKEKPTSVSACCILLKSHLATGTAKLTLLSSPRVFNHTASVVRVSTFATLTDQNARLLSSVKGSDDSGLAHFLSLFAMLKRELSQVQFLRMSDNEMV